MKNNGTVKSIGTLYRRKGGRQFPPDADARRKEVREAPFYIRYTINGRQVRQVLRNEKGDKIYDREEAEDARIRLLKPLLSRHKADQVKEYISLLRDAELEAADAERRQAGGIRLDQAWTAFIDSPNRRDTGEATLKQYRFQFEKFLSWVSANRSEIANMADVGMADAKAFAKDLIAKGVSGNTFNKYIGLLKMLFNVLAEEACIESNPWESIKRKDQTPQSREVLSKADLRKVCENAEGDLRVLFAIGMYTGLRLKDCCLLEWRQVDLERNKLIVVPSKTKRKHSREPIHIPLHPVLRKILLETAAARRTGYVLPVLAKKYQERPDKLSRQIQKHFSKCGIATIKPGTGGERGSRAVVRIGFHSLRHTFVSICRDENVPLSVVEAIVGHSNPAMTRLYTHVSEESAAKAINSLPDLLGTADEESEEAPDMLGIIRRKLQAMNSRNYRKVKAELLDLIENEGAGI